MTSTTTDVIASDGVTLLRRKWESDAPRARMLIIHGLGEHSGRYEHVGEFFVDRGFEVTAFDLRGHGASGGPRVDLESFEEYLDDAQLIFSGTEQNLPAVIYGHSMGGLIGASYAASSRPQPSVYVLSAPALDAEVPAPLRLASQVLSRIGPRLRLKNSIKGSQLSRDPAVGEAYFADPLVETKATARFGSVLLGQMARMRDQLSTISTPMLVIHGAEDELVPPHASAPLAAVAGVDRKLFAGLRHETHNEPEQAEVLDFVAGWLDGQLA